MIKSTNQEGIMIFDFSAGKNDSGWQNVSDEVMGGLSTGHILKKSNFLLFEGIVSTENNGGFTLFRKQIDLEKIASKSVFELNLKGGVGKSYQFRVKQHISDRHAYVCRFETNGKWQNMKIPFDQLLPKFRGRSLDMSPFEGDQVEEIAFLMGNKRPETFNLQLSRIRAV